jgi:hypothetical protein
MPRDRARKPGPSPLPDSVADAISAYVAEGLIAQNFIPTGETEYELRKSVESRAYVNWLMNPKDSARTHLMMPEDTRTVFLKRHHVGLPLLESQAEEATTDGQRARFENDMTNFRTNQEAMRAAKERAQAAKAEKHTRNPDFSTVGEILDQGDAYEPDDEQPPPME